MADLTAGDNKDKKPAAAPSAPAKPPVPAAKPASPSKPSPPGQTIHSTGNGLNPKPSTAGQPPAPKPLPTPGKPAFSPPHPSSSVATTAGRNPVPPVAPSVKVPLPHAPVRVISHEGGSQVARDAHGRLVDVDRPGLHIHHDVRGNRVFESQDNRRRFVGHGRGTGFVERPYTNRYGRAYVQRTYIVEGRNYAVVYRSYSYRNVVYYSYVPAYYYRPAFYGWAYAPWPAPVAYGWGWVGDPWYAAYGYYFAPYAAYAAANQWLADYVIAENLRLAYEEAALAAAQQSQPDQSQAPAVMPEDVKRMVADEVKRELAEAQAAAQHPSQEASFASAARDLPVALDPQRRLFIVAGTLDLAGDAGECAVTAGDVLLRTADVADNNNSVAVQVVSSKRGDCPVATVSQVQVSDLQEMHNRFRERLDAGLKSLAERQGKTGLPAAPDTATSPGEVGAATPDANAAAELQAQQETVARVESRIQASTAKEK